MYIIWLAAWAKLYKTVHSTVHMISCFDCTVQLTNTNQRGASPFAWTEGYGENTEMVYLHDNVTPCPPPMSSCFELGLLANDGNSLAHSVLLVSKNVRKQSPLKIEKYGHFLFWYFLIRAKLSDLQRFRRYWCCTHYAWTNCTHKLFCSLCTSVQENQVPANNNCDISAKLPTNAKLLQPLMMNDPLWL
jgi:hypothetical protein